MCWAVMIFRAVLCCTVLFSTILQCTALPNTVPYCTVIHFPRFIWSIYGCVCFSVDIASLHFAMFRQFDAEQEMLTSDSESYEDDIEVEDDEVQ